MNSSEHALAQKRRALYPRGLVQPTGSFRFSIDALLLASLFSSERIDKSRIIDLGTGCGVVALSMLLQNPDAQVIGIDKQSILINAAKANIAALDFASQMQVFCFNLDVVTDVDLSWLDGVSVQGNASVVLANPPYRLLGTGRLPVNPIRRDALFGDSRTLDVFCKSAAYCLSPVGRCGFVFVADRLGDLNKSLHKNGLYCTSVTYVFSRKNTSPALVLVKAAKEKTSFSEHNLYLYTDEGGKRSYTEEALKFCPFLACNAG